ncbi:hypothetical protein CANARDRAFT_9101 [[Candida] arabinofermentans NRRL YB-2248]|uniref:Glyoxylate reductase n=1 Tax=[Candida] arabinofermentans NRRL YB-2248 TaxID=983967 RepID=A0A1E4SWD7_9ASCO|nr:hypothetical protein CANARDRAFT_9101 [[Candida] arabinofermentans NRRL YB-2248]
MSYKPTVLHVGDIEYSTELWKSLSKIANVIYLPQSSTYEEFSSIPNSNEIVVIAKTPQSKTFTGQFDKHVFDLFPSLKLVAHNGAGYDSVDVSEATNRGIQVTNTPGLVDDCTADIHLYLLLGVIRNCGMANHLIKDWKSAASPCAGAPIGRSPSGLTIGIIGMGGIGRAIRERLKAFKFKRIIYYNRTRLDSDADEGSEYVSFDQLLAESDVISIICSLNKTTHHLINDQTINKMKDGVMIINTARGAVIDTEALLKNLDSGKISCAGLDVFEDEPEPHPSLLSRPNVLTTPHLGTWTIEATTTMEELVIDNVTSYINTGLAKTLVPEQQSVQFISGR